MDTNIDYSINILYQQIINFIFSFALLKPWLCYANFLLVDNKDFLKLEI